MPDGCRSSGARRGSCRLNTAWLCWSECRVRWVACPGERRDFRSRQGTRQRNGDLLVLGAQEFALAEATFSINPALAGYERFGFVFSEGIDARTPSPIPEPSSWALVTMGLLAVGTYRRIKSKEAS